MQEDNLQIEHCFLCGRFTNHRLLAQYDKSHYWENKSKSITHLVEGVLYSVLECCGCESLRFKKETWSDDSDTDQEGNPITNKEIYPPSSFRVLPDWYHMLDPEWHITRLYTEIYQAIKFKAPALAAMGIRALIEAIMIDKVGDHGSFKRNLEKFKDAGFISEVDRNILATTIEIGHASMHRSFIPQQDHLAVAVDITEKLLHTLYLLERNAQNVQTDIPKR